RESGLLDHSPLYAQDLDRARAADVFSQLPLHGPVSESLEAPRRHPGRSFELSDHVLRRPDRRHLAGRKADAAWHHRRNHDPLEHAVDHGLGREASAFPEGSGNGEIMTKSKTGGKSDPQVVEAINHAFDLDSKGQTELAVQHLSALITKFPTVGSLRSCIA